MLLKRPNCLLRLMPHAVRIRASDGRRWITSQHNSTCHCQFRIVAESICGSPSDTASRSGSVDNRSPTVRTPGSSSRSAVVLSIGRAFSSVLPISPGNYPAAIQNQERPPPGSWLSRQSIPAMRPTLNSQQRFFVCDGLGRMRLTDASETRAFGERSRCRRVRGNGGPDGSRGGPGPDQGRGGRFLFCQTGSRGRAETMGDANGARFLCVQLCERLFEDFLGRRLTDRRIILWQRFDHFAVGLKFLKNGFNRRSFLHLFPLLRDPEERWSTGTSRRGTKSSWREE